MATWNIKAIPLGANYVIKSAITVGPIMISRYGFLISVFYYQWVNADNGGYWD